MKILAKFKFELNRAGVAELLQSQEMLDILDEYANTALSRLPDGYGITSGMAVNMRKGARVRTVIGTRTKEAVKDNSQNNSLLKALGGG